MWKRDHHENASFILLLSINTMIYVAASAYMPFFFFFFKLHGVDTFKIGILTTIGCFSSILVQPIWAKFSDASGRAKSWAIRVTLLSGCSLILYLCGASFATFLVATIVSTLFLTSINSQIDAIVIRNCYKNNYSFANVRLGGTIGYAIIVVIAGRVNNREPRLSFVLGLILYMVLAAILLRLPDSENSRPIVKENTYNFLRLPKIRELFSDREVYFVLIYAFIYQIGASFLGTFQGVYVLEAGRGQREIGILQCISACSEIPILLLTKNVEKKFGIMKIIAASSLLMGVRILVFSLGSFPYFILAQLMQGCTYMLMYYFSAIYVSQKANVGREAEAQSLLYLIQTGLASMIGNIGGGVLVNRIGIQPGFQLSGLLVTTASITVMTLSGHRKRIGNIS